MDWTPPDLWAEIPVDPLIAPLRAAIEAQDPAAFERAIQHAPVGVFVRQKNQVNRSLPDALDAVFPGHLALAGAIEFGEWERARALAGPADDEIARAHAGEIDAVTAPLGARATSVARDRIEHPIVAWRALVDADWRTYRHIERSVLRRRTDDMGYVPEGPTPVPQVWRQYRRLEELALLAMTEAVGGRLQVAIGAARETQTLGDPDSFRVAQAREIEQLVLVAIGERPRAQTGWLAYCAGPHGLSPRRAAAMLIELLPLLALDGEDFERAARWAADLSTRLGSPRLLLQAEAWLLASHMKDGTAGRTRERANALMVKANIAERSLRVLPTLLWGVATSDVEAFARAAHFAHEAGNVLLEVSARARLCALRPSPLEARRLHRLLLATGWRRPALVPANVIADAAIALAKLGHRSTAVMAFARASADATAVIEVARAHLEDLECHHDLHSEAVRELARAGSPKAKTLLRAYAKDPMLGPIVSELLAHRPARLGLSDREAEVLALVRRGKTNREIATVLSLSEYTIARHIANARSKLGAANRAEAAAASD